MTLSIRRALGAAATAVAAGTASLAAQGSTSPQVTVSGVAYTQFVYQLRDTANHNNNFDITRAYVNALGKFSGGVSTRITLDVYRQAGDGSLRYRLKYAFAAYTPSGSPLTFKIGQIHTPLLDWEEALWDYRMQGQMAMERGGYVSSSDFGAGVDGKWGPDRINFQVMVGNGENYSGGTGDQRKDLMGRVSVRVLDTDDSSRVGGLRITAYGQYGKPTGGGERQRLLAMLSYRSKQIILAGEAAVTRDSSTAGPTPEINGHVYSAFGVYKFTPSKAALLARVDITKPNAGSTTNKLTRFIVGASYQLSPNWRLLADWDHLSFQTDPLNAANDATRSQALFQTQFTF